MTASTPSPGASETLRQVAESYWEGVLRLDPLLATFYGDNRYDDRLPDVGPERRAEEDASMRQMLRELDALAAEQLADNDLVTVGMLRLSAEAALDSNRLRLDEMAVDQMDGPQVWLADLLNWHPVGTPEGRETLIARYHAFPRHMRQYLDNLRDGIRDGRTAPTVAVDRVVGQLRELLATPVAQSPLVLPDREDAEPQRGALASAVEQAVYPAYQEMLDFLAGDYQQRHARQQPGVWSVTDGDEIYRMLARQHTTTDRTPDELHQIGLEEIASIQAEMRAIMERHGDTSGNVRAFTERLNADPSNQPATREDVVREAKELMARAYELLPRVFGRLPKTKCVVKPMEEWREKDAVAAFYFPPSPDGSREGAFFINTYEPQSRPRNKLPALVIHEAVPGHHMQIALNQEIAELPTFRKLSAGWLTNAYVEGWGLYSERLADELGFYQDDLARFGMLGDQAWRACRLVVDTGLHHLRWDRQRALEYFLDNVGGPDLDVVNEIDRYIIWPGQALSYKMGQREILSIRAEAQQRLGERFDLRAFHDEVLVHGAMPLTTLRTTMQAWVERQAGR